MAGDNAGVVAPANVIIFSVFKGCPADSPPQSLVDELEKIKIGLPEFVIIISTLRNAKEQIEDVCGIEPGLLTAAADSFISSLCRIGETLRNVRLFFKCDNWHPLYYESITYETLCYSGTEGFAWVASTQFVIVFMAMIILTLRVTFYEDEEEIAEEQIVEESIVEESKQEGIKASETSSHLSQRDDPCNSQKVPSSEYDKVIPLAGRRA
jgi:hypothetical protein